MVDVIVVGTRVAGASTALLLARRGLSVLTLDRARFPSDTVSTHQVQVPGGARLHRWGLLERLRAAGTPPARTVRFDAGPVVLQGRLPEVDGVVRGARRHRAQPPARGPPPARRRPAATAAQAHPDRARARRYAEELGAAMTAFQRTGDTRALIDHLAVDVEYQLFDGVRRRDRARFAAALASEFDDGIRAEPLGVTAGAGLTVVDLRLHNPSDQPLHCPPALTQLFLHDGRTVRRITSHYATLQPDATRA